MDHVLNVVATTEKILTDLKYPKDFIEEAKVAALLHNIGTIDGKEGHANRSYLMVKEYFSKNNIHLKNEEMVLEAIKIHSDGFDTGNIIALVLIFSDKLDIKKTRVAKEGYNIIGMRQFQYIDDIIISITQYTISVDFKATNGLSKKELENFYFIRKVFSAITSLANKLKINYKVTLNNDIWAIK